MKKNYLAPKSETLSAILKDMCAYVDPTTLEGGSGTNNGSTTGRPGGAPVIPHGL